jgi:SPP1 family predicted phage head-tail adaptor
MTTLIAISEMNRRITINSYLFGQNEWGGNIKTLVGTREAWAKVTRTSGSRTLDQMQIKYNETFEIIKRYDLSNPTEETNEILYADMVLSIGNIEQVKEGKTWFERIAAYSAGGNVSDSVEIFCNWNKVEW